MFDLFRVEPLPHIEIQREPHETEFRPRQSPRGGVQPRPNRQEHAQELTEQAAAATQALASLRRSLGIEASRLLVLRLEALDADQRQALERLGVTVVEELFERRDGRAVYRLLVQFPDDQALRTFQEEFNRYGSEVAETTALPAAMRRNLFDAIESISLVDREERRGRRLQAEGVPATEAFYLDVDLWNPGSEDGYRETMDIFRQVVTSFGGQVVGDPLRIPSMILAKIRATPQLLEALLDLYVVSLVDLPPQPIPEEAFDLFSNIIVPDPLPPVPPNRPLACVVDSGVIAGHPLLRGVVLAEEDFDSGEDSVADRNGHGTQVAGLVVYGDIARRMQSNEWLPQVAICSAKVLRNKSDPLDPSRGVPEFPDEHRVEDQLRRAIEYFHREYGCRVFNLSIGHSARVYNDGRQWAWAELLDELARTLDVVIVVSAGNVTDPDPPIGINSQQLQRKVLEALLVPSHRLIDPATAALCLTVGSVARRDDPAIGQAMLLAASPRDCPSPFTRCGHGVARAIKPELVAPGGNFAVDGLAGQARWHRQDVNLGEPTLNRDFTTGRLVRAVCGTSFSAAHVTHIAARVEATLREQLQRPPSSNLVRALVVNSARIDDRVRSWLENRQDVILSTLGYGRPSAELSCWSAENRVTLIAEDVLPYKTFHVYALQIPDEFLRTKGARRITVTIAFDPPARLSRRDYIANAMWLEIYRGLTTEQIVEYRSKYEGDGEPPKVPDANKLDFTPAGTTLRSSTVQSRSWQSRRGQKLDYRSSPTQEASFHVFVGCQPRFPHPLGEDRQRYALVVTLEHESQRISLYQAVRNRVRARARVRVPRS